MKKSGHPQNQLKSVFILIALLATICLSVGASRINPISSEVTEYHELLPENDSTKSLIAFKTVLKVIKDPRCINCHPSGDQPRQGDNQKVHAFGVNRGTSDLGGPVQKCNSCHKSENNPYTRVPGAPHWALAPKSMGWYGLSDPEIGLRLIDSSMNGGRTPKQLVQHMTEDSLVLWGWDPGVGREPVKVPFEEFKAALGAWLENGAYVPTK